MSDAQSGLLATVKDAIVVGEVAVIILISYVFFLAPVTLLRGEATTHTDRIAGIVGLAFWALAIMTLGQYR